MRPRFLKSLPVFPTFDAPNLTFMARPGRFESRRTNFQFRQCPLYFCLQSININLNYNHKVKKYFIHLVMILRGEKIPFLCDSSISKVHVNLLERKSTATSKFNYSRTCAKILYICTCGIEGNKSRREVE